MIKKFLTVFALAAILGVPAQAWTTLKTAKDVSATVAGKRLHATNGNGWWVLRRAGILTGGAGDQKMKGSWRMKDGLFCFNTQLGSRDRKDCAIIQKNSKNQVRLIYKSGKGRSATYNIKDL